MNKKIIAKRVAKRVAGLSAALLLAAMTARAEPPDARKVSNGPQEQIVSLHTRPGVTQSYLLTAEAAVPPRYVVVLFPGGGGALRLRMEDGTPANSMRGNFLVRARTLFADRDFAAATVDAPSDHAGEMDDFFRMGGEHARDMDAVVRDLKARFPGARVYLVGTSRGTVSAAYVSRALRDEVDGVVLTSAVTVGRRGAPGLSFFPFDEAKKPLLLVHHADDGCGVSPYAGAQRLSSLFPLVTVKGGQPPRSGPCNGKSAHGYFDMEAPTVEAIKDWIAGKPWPARVE